MKFKNVVIGFILLFGACSGSRELLYYHRSVHKIKWIAVQQPDATSIPGNISAEYLQKMLAYMIFQEKPYYIQPVDTTNAILKEVTLSETTTAELAQKLQVDGLLKYDFFSYIKNDDHIKGFIFSISLIDLNQGKTVWQAVEKYKGTEDLKSLQRLKQYMQSKVKEKSYLPFFAELYHNMKDAFRTLDSPDFDDDELSERLMNTTEPF